MTDTLPCTFLIPDWPAPAAVRAAVSTREQGLSRGVYAGFNLASHVGDDAACVAANRHWLQSALQLPEQPAWLTQVHGTAVLQRQTCGEVLPATLEYDACYTDQPDCVCAVMTADCLPVLFCSRDGQEVAAAHAGWRGLLHGVLATTLAAFRAPASEVLAWLGPAIGPASFVVGDEVREQFCQQWVAYGVDGVAQCFTASGEAQWQCDLYALARLQLGRLGVSGVFGGGEDTCADSRRFYSYRRDGDTGRMVSLIWKQ